MLTSDQRDRKSRLERQRAEIDAEIASIMAGARKPDRLKAAAERRERDKALTGGFGQRSAHNRDVDYLAWLHDGLPCIACEIEGPPAPFSGANPVEAAHQWIVRGPMKGKRAGHDTCAPICAWHHRLSPSACDKGQRAFWDRLGIDAADFTGALYGAFKAGSHGLAVIRKFIPTRTEA